MKQIFTKIFVSLFLFMPFSDAIGAAYTAGTSGNFSSTTTWVGGVVPPSNVGANDIIISSGVTVTLDVNLVLSSSFSLLQLQGNGRLASTSSHYIVLMGGNVTGNAASTIEVDSITFGNATYLFDGSITANKITLAGVNLPGNINIKAEKSLYFTSGITSFQAGATIALGTGTPPPTIVMDGGSFNIAGGVNFNLTTPYNLRYEQPSGIIGSGPELSGTGLGEIEIAIGAGNFVMLDNDLTVKNLLKLTSGSLALNNGTFKLIMAGNSSFDPGGTGSIQGSNNAEIVITSSATNLGTVRFAGSSPEVKNLEMKAANNNAELKLGSSLMISGQLNLQNGRLNVQDKTLSIAPGLGSITGGSANSYIITEANGQLKQDIVANSTVNFPVGYASAYAPVAITDQKGSHMAGVMVNVQQGVKEQGAAGNNMAATKPLVDATWTTSLSGGGPAVSYSLEASWSAGMEVNSFDRNRSFVSQYTGGKWQNADGGAAGTAGSMYTSKKDSIKAAGTFAVLDATTLGIDNIVTEHRIAVYPNPAKDILHLVVDDAATVALYNAIGQPVGSANLIQGDNTINIDYLPAGVYFIQLSGEQVNGSGRFVKE